MPGTVLCGVGRMDGTVLTSSLCSAQGFLMVRNSLKYCQVIFLCCKRVSRINEALYHCAFSVFIVMFSISGLFLLSLCYEFQLRSLFDFQAFLHINSLVLLLQLFTFIMT